MGDFDNILTCSLGVTELQLVSYRKSAEPVLDDNENVLGTRVRFECAGEITAATVSGLAAALAAWQVTTSYDSHNRRVTRYHYQYTGTYAETYLDSLHVALRQAGGLVAASVAVTHHKTRTVTGRFEVLDTVDDSDPLELTETISHQRSGPLLREIRYPGTTPLIVQDDQAAWLYEQSGRAVGLAIKRGREIVQARKEYEATQRSGGQVVQQAQAFMDGPFGQATVTVGDREITVAEGFKTILGGQDSQTKAFVDAAKAEA